MSHDPSGNLIGCKNCSLNQLCIPFSLNDNELFLLDSIIERKNPIQKGQMLYQSGEEFRYLYAVKSGTLKSYRVTNNGGEQIISFYTAGNILGFDAINDGSHPTSAQALETSMICKISYKSLNALSETLPKLRQQLMRMMSNEIKIAQKMVLLLSKKNAEERLAAFLYHLSNRFSQRGFSGKEFRLTMTRSEIGNSLGLTVETISRLLSKFQKDNVLIVRGKYIFILNVSVLRQLAGSQD